MRSALSTCVLSKKAAAAFPDITNVRQRSGDGCRHLHTPGPPVHGASSHALLRSSVSSRRGRREHTKLNSRRVSIPPVSFFFVLFSFFLFHIHRQEPAHRRRRRRRHRVSLLPGAPRRRLRESRKAEVRTFVD